MGTIVFIGSWFWFITTIVYWIILFLFLSQAPRHVREMKWAAAVIKWRKTILILLSVALIGSNFQYTSRPNERTVFVPHESLNQPDLSNRIYNK